MIRPADWEDIQKYIKELTNVPKDFVFEGDNKVGIFKLSYMNGLFECHGTGRWSNGATIYNIKYTIYPWGNYEMPWDFHDVNQVKGSIRVWIEQYINLYLEMEGKPLIILRQEHFPPPPEPPEPEFLAMDIPNQIQIVLEKLRGSAHGDYLSAEIKVWIPNTPTNQVEYIINKLIDEELIQSISADSAHIFKLTVKGNDVLDAGGWQKYIDEKKESRELDQLLKKSAIAANEAVAKKSDSSKWLKWSIGISVLIIGSILVPIWISNKPAKLPDINIHNNIYPDTSKKSPVIDSVRKTLQLNRKSPVQERIVETSKLKNDKQIVENNHAESHDQKGGITAAKVVINVQEDNLDSLARTIKDNFICNIDTVSKMIELYPKIGKWNEPFMAIPLAEKEPVQPQWHNKSGQWSGMVVGPNKVPTGDVYGVTCTGPPASKDFHYSISYTQLPSYIVFGDADPKGLIYQVDFKRK